MSVFTRGILQSMKTNIRMATTKRCANTATSIKLTTMQQIINVNNNHNPILLCSRHLSGGFSFAGPQKLNEIMKLELLKDKTKAEVSDMWMTYHEDKERVHGIIVNGDDGKKLIQRAEASPFFIQPIFRQDGYFMLLSQFQKPSHFLLAYLEDYKMDPNRAQPLMTFSIFNDLASSHDLSLIRCDVINKGIEDDEGRRVLELLVDTYKLDENYDTWVKQFNSQPEKFDVDDYISCMNQKWKE